VHDTWPYYRTFDEAMEAIDIAEKDVAADMGEDAVEGGGWVEIVAAVCADCDPAIIREVRRVKGLDTGFDFAFEQVPHVY
jgi:hypothetical protein